jgi:hypothetical protein
MCADQNKWRNFINNHLVTENEKMSIQLGGFKPDMDASKVNGQMPSQGVPTDDEFEYVAVYPNRVISLY